MVYGNWCRAAVKFYKLIVELQQYLDTPCADIYVIR